METTLFPTTIAPCVETCGPLYDANGGCVPPGADSGPEEQYTSCFCQHSTVQGIYSDPPADICNGACAADAVGYTSLRDWFTDFCTGVQNAEVADATTTSTSDSSGSSGQSAGQNWLESHWRWVVMLIIMFVGITGIWIGACIWRRRYLKRKEHIHKMGKGNQARNSSGTGVWAPGSGVDMPRSQPPVARQPPEFVPAPTPVEKPKKEKKKWVVKDRT